MSNGKRTAKTKKTPSGKERQQAVKKQHRGAVKPESALDYIPDRLMRAALILYNIDQELNGEDLSSIYNILSLKLGEPHIAIKTHTARNYLKELKELSNILPKPIVTRRQLGRKGYFHLTDYGREVVSYQTHRWKDVPTKATFQAWQREAADERLGVSTQTEQEPTIPEPEPTLTGAGLLDEYATEDEDLIEQGAIDTLTGEKQPMPPTERIDISKVADGLTARKFKELIKQNPALEAELAKSLGVRPSRASRAPEQEDDNMSMSRSMSRSMKEMMESMIQMQMWQVMMRNMGGNSGYAPNPLNPQQIIPYNPMYPQQPPQPQKSSTEQFKELMELMQLVQRPNVTMEDIEKKMQETQQATQMQQQFQQLRQAIEDQSRKSEQMGQQSQFDQIRQMILEMQREGVIQRNTPMAEVMQAMMQFQASQSQAQMQNQAQQAQADRNWQQQIEQYREARVQRDAEYTNAQIEGLKQMMQQGRGGVSDKFTEVMEDIMIGRLRSVQDEGKDSEAQKLLILKDMVGTATEGIAAPLMESVSEGLKEGVRERVARAEQQGVATSPSAIPAPDVLLAPQASPAPPSMIPQPATTPPPQPIPNPLHQMSGLEIGLPEGTPVTPPKKIINELP